MGYLIAAILFVLFVYPFVLAIGGPFFGRYSVRGNKPDPKWPGYQFSCEYGRKRPKEKEKTPVNWDSPGCLFPWLNPELQKETKDTEDRKNEEEPIKEEPKEPEKTPKDKAKEWIDAKADLITEATKPEGEPGRVVRIKAKELENVDNDTRDEIVMLILIIYARTVSSCGIEPETGDMLIKMA